MSAGVSLAKAKVGLQAGYLVVGAAVLFALWRLFASKNPRLDIPPPIGPVGSSTPPPPQQEGPPVGLKSGGLTSAAIAYLIQPPDGGKVDRGLFRSSFPAIIEIDNESEKAASVVVDIEAYYDTGFGELEGPILSTFGPFPIGPLAVARVHVDVDTGQGFFEVQFGSLMGVFLVRTNGVQTQSTSFEIA